MNKCEITEKWKNLGFLDGLSLSDKQNFELAQAMEYAAKILIRDGKKCNRKYNDKVDIITFPILRLLIDKHEMSKPFILHLLEKLKKLTESSVYDGIEDLHPSTGVDPEAELIRLFVELHYGK